MHNRQKLKKDDKIPDDFSREFFIFTKIKNEVKFTSSKKNPFSHRGGGFCVRGFYRHFYGASLGIPLEAGRMLTFLALICSFVTVVVLIVDVFKNNLSTKYLWTLGFLLTGSVAGLYYLMNRDKYFRLS